MISMFTHLITDSNAKGHKPFPVLLVVNFNSNWTPGYCINPIASTIIC
jgi:hypothetical protein